MKEFRPATVAGVPRMGGYSGTTHQQVTELAAVTDQELTRIGVGINELDRVLGGGIVPGSVILIGGDPGIGKSTLLLQVLAGLMGHTKCLYISGEESLQQINMRAKRAEVTESESIQSVAAVHDYFRSSTSCMS